MPALLNAPHPVRLRFLARRFGVEVLEGGPSLYATLTRRAGRPALLLVGDGLTGEQRLPAAATLLRAYDLGWPLKMFRIAHPAPGDNAETLRRIARQFRRYHLPRRLGLRDLMPDPWLEVALADLPISAIAAEAGVSVADLALRLADWSGELGATADERRIAPGAWAPMLARANGQGALCAR